MSVKKAGQLNICGEETKPQETNKIMKNVMNADNCVMSSFVCSRYSVSSLLIFSCEIVWSYFSCTLTRWETHADTAPPTHNTHTIALIVHKGFRYNRKIITFQPAGILSWCYHRPHSHSCSCFCCRLVL